MEVSSIWKKAPKFNNQDGITIRQATMPMISKTRDAWVANGSTMLIKTYIPIKNKDNVNDDV